MNIQLQLNIENKHSRKYQRYKQACERKNCNKIEEYKNIDEILWCMIDCQFGYDYESRKEYGVNGNKKST